MMGVTRSCWRAAWLAGTLVILILSAACNRSPEAKSAKFMAQGKKLLEQKDPARAILLFRSATQVTPRDPEAQYQLALASLAAGDIRQGVAALRKTLELNPKHAGAQFHLAELMTSTNDPTLLKDAQQRLEALLQDSPHNADSLRALALTEFKLGDTDDAMQNLEQAVSAAPQELTFVVTLAEAKVSQKDPKGAEAILKKACDDFPKSLDAPVILGRFYVSQNRVAEAEQQFRRALAMDPNHGTALVNLAALQIQTGRSADAEKVLKQLSGQSDPVLNPIYAKFLFRQGRRNEVIQEFERLARQNPNDRDARTRLVAAYQAIGRTSDAQRILSAVLKKNQNDLDALLQRGELSFGIGNYTEAEADFNKVIHLKPDSPEVHYALSKLHQARGASLRRREELTATLKLNPRLLQVRLELTAALIEDKAGPAALDVINQTPEDQKGAVAVVEQRNWALLSMGKGAEARGGVDLGLVKARTPDLLLQDAILKISAKRYPEARQSLHEILGKSPEDLRALRVLVGSYASQNQIGGAVNELRAYAAAHPKSADIQYLLGKLLMQTGNKEQAKVALAAAKAINPNYTPAELSLAQIDMLQSNWTDARQELTAILSKKGDNSVARQWLGVLDVSVGDQSAAIADFRKVIDADPNNARALNNLAYLLAETGTKTDEPLKYAQRAKELDPENPNYEDTLGWILYRRGVYDLAVKHLERVVSKQPRAQYQYHLAMAYYKAGNETRGRETLRTALRLDPSLPEALVAQQMFQSQSKPEARR